MRPRTFSAPRTATVDCIIVGYNERSFPSIWNEAERLGLGGKQRALELDSVECQGERVTYETLLNRYLARKNGVESNLRVCRLPNLAISYLYTYLSKRGFNVEIVNLFTEGRDRLASLLARNPKSVAITTTLYTDSAPIVEIVRFIKRHNPATRIIAGGPHIYNLCSLYENRGALLNAALREIGADIYVNDSQGELALSRILRELGRSAAPECGSIPNLILRDGDSLRRTAREPENNSLDDNSVDWSSLDRSFLGRITPMRTARSCAFSCAFCNYPHFAGPLNLMSLDVVEKELRQLAEIGVQHVMFIDDTFNVPLDRFKRICKIMIEGRFNFHWYSYFRCSNADDEAFSLMRESGCRAVFLGIESGDQKILDNMNKAARVEHYRRGIQKLREHGIVTFASFIIGFPGETRESALNTLDFIEEEAPTFYRVMPYFHYQTTPIARRAGDFGIRGGGYSWKHDTMDYGQALDWVQTVYRTVTRSLILPEQDFGFWAIPYLLDNGFSLDELTQFMAGAQRLFLQGITSSSSAEAAQTA